MLAIQYSEGNPLDAAATVLMALLGTLLSKAMWHHPHPQDQTNGDSDCGYSWFFFFLSLSPLHLPIGRWWRKVLIHFFVPRFAICIRHRNCCIVANCRHGFFSVIAFHIFQALGGLKHIFCEKEKRTTTKMVEIKAPNATLSYAL